MPPPNVVWPEAYCVCPVRPYMCPCVRPETLLTQYLAECLTDFYQKLTSTTQRHKKVKGQGHGGIKCAGNSTFWAC